jgi:hypothetical protein
MKIKCVTKKDKFPEMIKQLETLNNKTVEVGCIKGEHAWLASIHEYGCNITVTPKMRAFLHSKGLHLSQNTKVIRIPERSFLRTGHDNNIDDVMDKAEKLLGQVVNGKMSEKQLLNFIGLTLSGKIKTYARDLSSPPNNGFTIEQKNSSNPLVKTGNMIEGISFEVK